MNSNLPVVQKRIKKPFFKKVINFVKNIFKKDKTARTEKKMRDRIEINAARLREAYKVNSSEFNPTKDIEKRKKISDIIKLVEKDPEALQNLDITNYIDNKILENEEIIKIKFYELVVKEKLSKTQVTDFLKYSVIRLKNIGYKIYDQGEIYTYNGNEYKVETDLFYVAIKEKMVITIK